MSAPTTPTLPDFLSSMELQPGWEHDTNILCLVLLIFEGRIRAGLAVRDEVDLADWVGDWVPMISSMYSVVDYARHHPDISISEVVNVALAANPLDETFPLSKADLVRTAPNFDPPAYIGENCWWEDFSSDSSSSDDSPSEGAIPTAPAPERGPRLGPAPVTPPAPSPSGHVGGNTKRPRSQEAESDSSAPSEPPRRPTGKKPATHQDKGKQKAVLTQPSSGGRGTRRSTRKRITHTPAAPSNLSGPGDVSTTPDQGHRLDGAILQDLQRDMDLIRVRIAGITERVAKLASKEQVQDINTQVAALAAKQGEIWKLLHPESQQSDGDGDDEDMDANAGRQ
ncbi:hypothetical protein CONPUDRAFT_160705 [Coniophora puteana RWD-64-598 SS2]|uniref:Uncharacterized protein n=1 Tax=Coniophora puteana (strain RWD-64-598) TaxID=741705 RepID=R7SFE2_CONPW|nr:uncharacterized protein CONPUDRAFT_160705 [Coniophora puteana RWD-64-598 SS2]EIW73794.1 hypothetical protein CONPUDRAFT_160705 [Coniophora puteana RWD-64-598 SS2]